MCTAEHFQGKIQQDTIVTPPHTTRGSESSDSSNSFIVVDWNGETEIVQNKLDLDDMSHNLDFFENGYCMAKRNFCSKKVDFKLNLLTDERIQSKEVQPF